MSEDKVDPQVVRKLALEKYAEWFKMWAEYNGDDVSYDQYREDLLKYSDEYVEVTERHDHTMYTIFPSVGDEAGMWTLYVVADTFMPFGSLGKLGDPSPSVKELMGEVRIMAMWAVFDTRPYAVLEVEDEFDKDLGHTVPKEIWLSRPESKEGE